ncbi:MAG: aspartate/glutamate racemase family protein [Ignavibacteriales bacterium]|nr:aspartate/glutamate racemase family protein [Ignavibacteriales bacterium]
MTRRTVHRNSTTRGAAVVALLLLQLFPLHFSLSQSNVRRQIARLFERDSVTILITDSGLGGLSVCADLEAELSMLKSFRTVRLIFVNALPDIARTYNSMTNKEKQARVFDKALEGFVRWYQPDVILIACNTLSAVYPETEFARNATIPVVSIIDVGARMIAERAKAIPNSSVLILGTATTIASGLYEQKLGELGVPTSEIVTQPCQLLETEIQADPKSDLVSNLVEVYVEEAMEKIGNPPAGTLIVGLCCSHYGYSLDAFDRSFKQQGALKYGLVNPNKAMVALFENAAVRGKVHVTSMSVEVASRVKFTPQEISSIARSVGQTSQKTAQALRHYTFNENLFQVK